MDGVLNINKPKGITSHDVVSAVRRIIGEKRVGHTGTLDPIATGVLLICIGKATSFASLLTRCRKTYVADMGLGKKTDTQDATGSVVASCSNCSIDEEKVEKAFLKFTGDIEQVPPMYSALKHKGERLYRLARKGIVVERKARKVHIYNMRLIDSGDNRIRFEVESSPGTYIRTLCEQIGDELGCNGHLVELQRTAIGDFKLTDSVSLDDLVVFYKNGRFNDVLIPMDKIH
jgi:tRNA pseudouridine55 synthase